MNFYTKLSIDECVYIVNEENSAERKQVMQEHFSR